MLDQDPALRRNLQRDIKVSLNNLADFTSGDARFGYGTVSTLTNIHPEVFFKLANTPEGKKQLIRESKGLSLALQMGIPTVGLAMPYQEVADGYGSFATNYIDPEQWTLIKGWPMLAEADPQLGHRAGLLLYLTSGTEIFSHIDTEGLETTNRIIMSQNSFWEEWIKLKKNTIDIARNICANESAERIAIQSDLVTTEIKPLILQAESREKRFFVHGDMTPYNMGFSKATNVALVLDFEYAGVTHNRFLAQLADLSNFYGRCWANPDMAFNALWTYRNLSKEDPQTLYKLEKAALVFGTMLFAKHATDETHPMYFMANYHLKNFNNNIMRFEREISP